MRAKCESRLPDTIMPRGGTTEADLVTSPHWAIEFSLTGVDGETFTDCILTLPFDAVDDMWELID